MSTALILGAVAVSEGIRATPEGSLVLRRILSGRWTYAEPLALGRGFTLPSIGTPFMVAILVRPAGVPADARAAAQKLRDRLAAARRTVATLRALGTLSLALLVAGLPAFTARSGWFGLAAALAAILVLAVAQAVIVGRAMLRASATRRAAWGAAARVLWPFTTPRSAEYVLDQLVVDVPPLAAARVLLPEEDFRRFVRPLAWDVLHGRSAAEAPALLALCDPAELRAIVDTPASEPDRFCPRCAAGYAPGIRECVECPGVPIAGA